MKPQTVISTKRYQNAAATTTAIAAEVFFLQPDDSAAADMTKDSTNEMRAPDVKPQTVVTTKR